MSSGPPLVVVLEETVAIKQWRTLMAATDPAKADAGTLRKEFAESIERNATHGSDAPETAVYEIGYFFAGLELGRASDSASPPVTPKRNRFSLVSLVFPVVMYGGMGKTLVWSGLVIAALGLVM